MTVRDIIFKLCFTLFVLTNIFDVEAKFVRGKVILDNEPLSGIKVKINGSIMTTSDRLGSFTIDLNIGVESIEIISFGYESSPKWRYYQDENLINIKLKKIGEPLYGKVKDENNVAVKGAIINLLSHTIRTDKEGEFKMLTPVGSDKNFIKQILVNGYAPTLIDVKPIPHGFYISVVINSNNEVSTKDASDTQQTTLPVSQDTIASVEDTELLVKKIIVQVRDKDSVSNIRIELDDEILTTNADGVVILDEPLSISDFEKKNIHVVDYEISSKQIVNSTVYLFIDVKSTVVAPHSTEKVLTSIYKKEFSNIYDEVKIQKQFLEEHNVAMREEIIKIAQKFNKLRDKDSTTIQEFLGYLAEVSHQVDRNYDDYQKNIGKTIAIIDTIESNVSVGQDTLDKILTKHSKFLTEEEDPINQRYIRRYLSAFILSIVALTTVLVIIIYGDRKIRLKNQQLEDTNDALHTSKGNLEHQIGLLNVERSKTEKAYQNIQLISKIGQKVTSNLERDVIIHNAYKNIHGLLKINEFEVAIHNNLYNTLEVSTYKSYEDNLHNATEKLAETKSILSWCFQHEEEIIIGDSEKELARYGNNFLNDLNVNNYSAIYIPLKVKDKALGVLGIKNFKVNTYNKNDLDIVRAFGSYIAVALENSNAYKIIKQNNEQMTDSLMYAQKMQKIILPTDKQLADSFKDHFVIYRPKDIVSGDFYWITKVKTKNDKNAILLGIADCTGHGVPGAFMSILGVRLLNEVVSQQNVTIPSVILEKLNAKVQKTLRQYEKNNNDGMDIALCLFENFDEKKKMTFSGAKSCIYFYDNKVKNITRIKGDNKLIGGISDKQYIFKDQSIYLNEEDILYFSSDGILHQNNTQKEKFGTKRFMDLLSIIAKDSFEQQKKTIESELDDFQSNTLQRDDITVVGIRIKA